MNNATQVREFQSEFPSMVNILRSNLKEQSSRDNQQLTESELDLIVETDLNSIIKEAVKVDVSNKTIAKIITQANVRGGFRSFTGWIIGCVRNCKSKSPDTLSASTTQSTVDNNFEDEDEKQQVSTSSKSKSKKTRTVNSSVARTDVRTSVTAKKELAKLAKAANMSVAEYGGTLLEKAVEIASIA